MIAILLFGIFLQMPGDGKRNSYELFEERLRKSLRVDARYSILEFIPAKDYLYIFTDSLANAMHISQVYQDLSIRFRIKIVFLPDKSVGLQTKGVCHVGVAPVRRYAASASEQVTQVLYGETFDTLQIDRTWVRIRLHADGYIGWISSDQATLMDDDTFYDFQFLPKVFVAGDVVPLRAKPSPRADILREAVYPATLKVVGAKGRFLSVRMPDGLVAWVDKTSTSNSIVRREFSVKNLLNTARRFLGVSYIWGGRSAKGFDCSGFVQTVYRLNGISLPRDADMQFKAGEGLGTSIRKLRAGDLLFFSSNGNKITHVAIYTGKNEEFIHSSGFVRVNSFDRKRKNFSNKLLSTFVGACRVV